MVNPSLDLGSISSKEVLDSKSKDLTKSNSENKSSQKKKKESKCHSDIDSNGQSQSDAKGHGQSDAKDKSKVKAVSKRKAHSKTKSKDNSLGQTRGDNELLSASKDQETSDEQVQVLEKDPSKAQSAGANEAFSLQAEPVASSLLDSFTNEPLLGQKPNSLFSTLKSQKQSSNLSLEPSDNQSLFNEGLIANSLSDHAQSQGLTKAKANQANQAKQALLGSPVKLSEPELHGEQAKLGDPEQQGEQGQLAELEQTNNQDGEQGKDAEPAKHDETVGLGEDKDRAEAESKDEALLVDASLGSLFPDSHIMEQGNLLSAVQGEHDKDDSKSDLVYVSLKKVSLEEQYSDVLAPSENLEDRLEEEDNNDYDIYAPAKPAFDYDYETHQMISIYDEPSFGNESSTSDKQEEKALKSNCVQDQGLDVTLDSDKIKASAKDKKKAKDMSDFSIFKGKRASAKPKVVYEPYVYPIDPKVYAICGIDEAGRGPLMGDVVAACVILDHNHMIEGLNDSKKLSEKARDALAPIIKEQAIAYGIGRASPEEIDEHNILNATFLAMRRAFDAMGRNCNLALVDGNKIPKSFNDIPMAIEAVVKGDARVAEISAASILAKTARDADCIALDKLYPEYGFAKHKGYPTKDHLEALAHLPILPCYRLSYGPVKKLLANMNPNNQELNPDFAKRIALIQAIEQKKKDDLYEEYRVISIEDFN